MSGRRFGAGNGIMYEFAASGTTFLRSAPANSTTRYSPVPDSDLHPEDVAQFVGAFYSSSVDTRWRFADVNHGLILRRKGFPDEQLDFEFRDACLGDLGLFHFIRDRGR